MKIVKEHINFERGLNPKAAMNIGMLTWDKLKPGDILQNKKTVYLQNNKISFVSNDNFLDRVNFGKYWTIKYIQSDKELDGTSTLKIELIWSGIFRHATSIAEKITGKKLGYITALSYTNDNSIEEWNKYFRIIQPNEYENEYSK